MGEGSRRADSAEMKSCTRGGAGAACCEAEIAAEVESEDAADMLAPAREIRSLDRAL